ncbi:amidohydrolase family protein [Pedobacter sp. MC2016-15]|uniref:amidohydrolase family protein n=1 Tax=Pedobacter sp. MC2016-15 TaxID=2994473 RepID=UPI002247E1CE|nr:amidohydrolase family protein [Pedobacter sp. MC2016-15]MCX2481208.1 amidohydrolase family protein [Pedobacter sp. MC2016-15]
MISYISASWIYPVSTEPLENGVIALHPDGTIEEVLSAEEASARNITDISSHEGILVPGLVNTHCHLELSHLKGKIAEHTGLPGFVQQVIQQRASSPEEIENAMLHADEEMYNNGIVAVGDISNQPVSKNVKLNSKIYYHTFVEAMGFNPAKAGDIIAAAKLTREAFAPLKATIVPHAPYSVSAELFQEINALSGITGESVSIHNQETADENAFFESKTGHFLKLYEFLGLDISFFEAGGKSSLQSYLPRLSAAPRTLLVHNTFTSKADLEFAALTHPQLFWCLCPNANLYIENRLPDIALLKDAGIRLTLGTDSLASNHQLSILAEMLSLQEREAVSFEDVLRWATLNGAAFLGIDTIYGSFEKGKKPGLNLITGTEEGRITNRTKIKRLI